METTINQRVSIIIKNLFDNNASEFCRKTKIKQSSLASVITGRMSLPGYPFIKSIVDALPSINAEWLINGTGEMLKDKPQIVKYGYGGVPYYESQEAFCSIVTTYDDMEETPTYFIDFKPFNDCTAYITACGDSMYPMYCAGDIIAVKELHNMDTLLWGEAYLVVTNSNADNLRTIKLVFAHEEADKLILKASNPNYKGDTIIRKEDILHLYVVKGKIKRNML